MGGNDEFVNFDIYVGNSSVYQLNQMTLVLGPYCDNANCRSNISHELYDENLATFVSTTQINPSATVNSAKVYDKGVQMIPLSTLGKNFTDVFVTIQYRHAERLDEQNRMSDIPYSIYIIQNYSASNELTY